MSRLTLLHINIIGFFVAVVVGVALYFTLITDAQKQIETNQGELKGVQDRADKLTMAQAALKRAQEDKKRTEIDYAGYNDKYMPILGYTDNRITTMQRVWWPNGGRSWPERFIRGVRAHMAAERKLLGVSWLNPEVLVLPAYGPDPNAIDMGDQSNTLHFGPYAFSVRGRNYPSLIQHLKDWQNVSGLGVATVEGVTLTGNSPELVASYNVTFTIILKEKIPVTDPRVAGSGGAGGGPGGGGAFGPPFGRMGPMMGGSGMMSGPPTGGPMMGGGGPAPAAAGAGAASMRRGSGAMAQ